MVKPLGDRVLLKECEREVEELGGIVLPDSAKERQQQKSEVICLGTGEKDVDFAVAIGDVVITKKFSGTEIKINGEEFKIINQSEILAVLKQGE